MRRDLILRLAALLAEPDPPDLIGRGAHVTCPGEPDRRRGRYLPLVQCWAQYRCLAVDGEPLPRPARVLRFPGMRFMRRVG